MSGWVPDCAPSGYQTSQGNSRSRAVSSAWIVRTPTTHGPRTNGFTLFDNPNVQHGVVIHALGGFFEVRCLGLRDVRKYLRVTIGQREPAALNLHHDAMPG